MDSWTSLINFRNVPGGLISGKSASEVEEIAKKSLERMPDNPDDMVPGCSKDLATEMLNDDDFSFLDGLRDLAPEIEAELNIAEELIKNKSTEQKTRETISRFKTFLTGNGYSSEIEKMQPYFLDQYLRHFYSSLKKSDGTFYAPSTLLSIRSAINRYLSSFRPVNLCADSEFKRSNVMLKIMVGRFLNAGGRIQHYNPIEENDMQTLSRYFDRKNPVSLQDEIIFNIIYYFGQRGRERIRQLQKEDFIIGLSSDGSKYVEIQTGSVSKNVKPSLKRETFSDVKQCKMFENKENPQVCPVKAFETYIAKISNCSNLFPKPLEKYCPDRWYSEKACRGKDYMGNIMKMLSQKLSLTKTYTNHCIRSTVVSNMIDNGHDVSDVAAVTGHKSSDALRKYASHKRESQIQSFSETLNKTLHKRAINERPEDEIEHQNSKKSKLSPTQSTSTKSTVSIEHKDYVTKQISAIFGNQSNINIGNLNINFYNTA